jgi:hypothetical protein
MEAAYAVSKWRRRYVDFPFIFDINVRKAWRILTFVISEITKSDEQITKCYFFPITNRLASI